MAEITKQQILSTIWIGKKSGKCFRVLGVTSDGDETEITYSTLAGKCYVRPKSLFLSNLRPVTVDEAWAKLRQGDLSEDDMTIGKIVEPDHRHSFDWLILRNHTMAEIMAGLNGIRNSSTINDVWGISAIQPLINRSVMNFHGPPGVGKTHSALAVAHFLNQKMLQVDYSEIVSKYIGETAKKIKIAFETAKEKKAILFFDEADTLLSQRVSSGGEGGNEALSAEINQSRNVLMQCIDSFDSVVIMSTNFFGNYDSAMLRRISRSVQFELPDAGMLRQIYLRHVTKPELFELSAAEWDNLADNSVGLSGGDVLVVVLNAIARASMDPDQSTWKMSYESLMAEARSTLNSKAIHAAESAQFSR